MWLGRRLRDFLPYILERMKGPSIKTNMWKISVMLLESFLILYRGRLFLRALIWSKEIGMPHAFWDSLDISNHLVL